MKHAIISLIFVLFAGFASSQQNHSRYIMSFSMGINGEFWQGDIPDIDMKPVSLGYLFQEDMQFRLGGSPFFISTGVLYRHHGLSSDAIVRSDAGNRNYFLRIDSLEPLGEVEYRRNRFSVGYLEIPLGLSYRAPGGFEAGAGIQAGVNVYAGTLFSGDDYIRHSGNDITVEFSRLPNVNLYRAGLTATLGYRFLMLRAYYALTDVFKKDKGPAIRPFSIGLAMNFWTDTRETPEITDDKVQPPPPPPPPLPLPEESIALPDTTMPVFTVVEKMPEYPGGEEERLKYLQENINYPKLAKESGVQGTVYVSFVIDSEGYVRDVRLLRGIGGGCDEEAIRVIKNMPRWIPGTQEGKGVNVQFTMPVKFTLNGGDESIFITDDSFKKISFAFGLFNDFWIEDDPGLEPKSLNLVTDVALLRNFRLGGSPFSLSAGVGVSWHMMRSNCLLLDSGDASYFKPVGEMGDYDYRKNKLVLSYLEIPLKMNYFTGFGLRASLGLKAGIVISSQSLYQGDDYLYGSENTQRIVFRRLEHLRALNYGLTAGIGYKFIWLSGYYAMSPLFKGEEGPEVSPFSVGIMLQFPF